MDKDKMNEVIKMINNGSDTGGGHMTKIELTEGCGYSDLPEDEVAMDKQYLKVWTGYIQHGRDAGYPIEKQAIMSFDRVLEGLDTELDEKYYEISEIPSDFFRPYVEDYERRKKEEEKEYKRKQLEDEIERKKKELEELEGK